MSYIDTHPMSHDACAHDAWYCRECSEIRQLDCHGRCEVCGSDSVIPAALVEISQSPTRVRPAA